MFWCLFLQPCLMVWNSPMKLALCCLSVGQLVYLLLWWFLSRSVSTFSQKLYRIFLILLMKLVKEKFFRKSHIFWEKSNSIPKFGFLEFVENLVHWYLLFPLKMTNLDVLYDSQKTVFLGKCGSQVTALDALDPSGCMIL